MFAKSCSLSYAITVLELATVEKKSGLHTLSNYLDDFTFAASNYSGNCYNLMRSFQSICTECAVPLADKKLGNPVTCLTLKCIEIGTDQLCIRIARRKYKS